MRTIESAGGGIFCYTALLAAGKMLEEAEQKNRHIILFADAADSEEQERCPELIERFQKMGITLSVIALGTEQDTDAEFLKRIAVLGGGEVYSRPGQRAAALVRARHADRLARDLRRGTHEQRRLARSLGLGELPSDLAARGFPRSPATT